MWHILKITILTLFLIIISISGFVYSQDIKEEARKHYWIGDFYYQQGRYKEAKEEFQKALDLISQEEIVADREVVVGLKRKVGEAESKERSIEYVIGEGDILHISVWQNPELEQDAIVRPDGRISFPLIGDVLTVNLSITQLDQELTKRLKKYIKHPEVSISIKKLGGKKVIVLGQVRNPGVHSVTGARTILEAIGLAGGFTPHAVASSVILIRGGFETPKAKRINLTKVIARGDMRENITLESEDIVFIPKKVIANLNYFLNQVLSSISRGRYTVEDIGDW